ncbi:Cell division protein FtsA [Anaerobiospirillum thomasii]|uniref:Cell division protein FtsA n=1 Tax=Anaerobiospirillum thomasii TaxID=179995 RepID=A0A2X0V4B6_9GAMM|nr:cell division protein FtsA [Anaerobiospirillum thomasii]SPT69359.1 Cell division protein FtsA [Anaerobiospirillum thomasii]SPT72068.1 Cell division protein FtsA [Anaerobiospirillum thomasii]
MFKAKNTKDSVKNNSSRDTVVAIDIGSSKIRLIAGNIAEDGNLNITYYTERYSDGIISGAVSDLQRVSEILSEIVQQYESDNKTTLMHCNIGISGKHIDSKNERGDIVVPSGIVSAIDKSKAIEMARSVKVKDGNHIIHVIPQSYELDNNYMVSNPIDQYAMRLGVNAHIISCAESQENNFRAAIEKVSPNVEIDNVIFSGLASANAVLTEPQKELGVCLIDFGEGTVDVCVYDRNKLVATFSLDRGGRSITEAIASEFHIPLSYAEELKKQYGVAFAKYLSDEDYNQLYNINASFADGVENNVIVKRGRLAEVIQNALMDIFNSICNNIEYLARQSPDAYNLSVGFVLTGGMANLPGIDILASSGLQPDRDVDSTRLVGVKIGIPLGVEAKSELADPSMAVPIGLLRYMPVIESVHKEDGVQPNSKVGKMFRAVTDWWKKEF